MTNLTFSGDSNFKSKENIKDNILKIFIIYSILSIIILTLLSLSGVRLFNSLNLSMTLISSGGFLPTDNISKIISTNFQKLIFIFSLLVSLLNFYLLFNLFNKKILIKNVIEKISIKTRQYAKRQRTWGRGHMSDWIKIHPNDLDLFLKKI